MTRFHRRSLNFALLSPIAIIAAFAACGNDGNGSGGSGGATGSGGAGATTGSGGSGGTSGGGATTGAGGEGTSASGGSGGGSASGGAPTGSAGGSDGTGGGGSQFAGVPGAEGYDCSAPSGTVPILAATPLVTNGLDAPIELAHEPGGAANRLFVLEMGGKIKIIEAGALVGTAFLDFGNKVAVGGAPGDERGALGFAFHPDYASNGLFYVHYSDEADPNDNGDSIIEEYKVTSDPNVADPGSGRLVMKVEQPYPTGRNHKGGSIHFGKDGHLYIGLGDGGNGGDPDGNGQKVDVLLGKISRINPMQSGGEPYSSPAGNLKDTIPSALPEIWDYGLRNPFRSSFDGCTGDFYIGDVGQNTWEEIDIEKAGEGGKNYGWNTMEGTHCYSPMSGCDMTGLTPPALEYGHTNNNASVTGGAVYRGSSMPALRGTYFYADYNSGAVWSVVYDRETGSVTSPVSHTQDLGIEQPVSIQNGADGELYIVSLSTGVYKLTAAE